MVQTFHVQTRRARRSFGCVLIAFAIGCGDQPSPSAPTAVGLSGPAPAQYHIHGAVLDNGGRFLSDAVVTIVDGPLAGTTTRAAWGPFEFLSPSPGTVTLRASRDGFQTQTRTTVWQRSGGVELGYGVTFGLDPLEPPIGLEPGAYTLAVNVDLTNARDWRERPDAPCAGFPSALASRTYRAEITEAPQPGYYTHVVTAEDPTLRWRDLFGFYISGSYVGFEMEGHDAGGAIYEDLPGFRYLEIGGFSTRTRPAIRNESSVSIPFEGAISYCQLKSARGMNEGCYQAPADQVVEHHVCFWESATLTFTKR